jgi:hypothetical protein
MLIPVVADYGLSDLAFAEVAQSFKLYLVETELLYTPGPPFATSTAGFCVAQLGLKAAYRLALNGYVEAARESYRKTNKEVRSNAL